MKNVNRQFLIYTFYRFIYIQNIKIIKKKLDLFLFKKKIRGTILISSEGINGSLSGSEIDLIECMKFLKRLINIKKLNIKINQIDFLPFKRLRVRLKKEIVTLAKGKIDVNKHGGKRISPHEWNNLITDKNTRVIDVRNNYEINVGKFKNSERPNTANFREFPKSIDSLGLKKDSKIAMYCTGGIRCEKASAYLSLKGFKNIMQLDGGIIKYLEYSKKENKKSLWQGECFVFDDRVTINKNLKKGKYHQCYGCRSPLTKDDAKSIYYKKGVSCPKCFNKRSEKQLKGSETRQRQIEQAESTGKDHPFKKLISV